MKAASGFLAMDGTFFDTPEACIRYETEQSIRRYCESQQPDPIDYDALIKIINDIAPFIRTYIDGIEADQEENDWPLTDDIHDAGGSGAGQGDEAGQEETTVEWPRSGTADDIDKEIEEARQQRERLFAGVADDGIGADDEAGPVTIEPGNDLSRYVNAGGTGTVSPVSISPTDQRQRARGVGPAKQQPTRRPVSLSDVGGGPLPAAVPDES